MLHVGRDHDPQRTADAFLAASGPAIFSALGITPYNLVERLQQLIRNIADLGADAFKSAFGYFLIGAVIVFPIWFVVRLMKRDSKP